MPTETLKAGGTYTSWNDMVDGFALKFPLADHVIINVTGTFTVGNALGVLDGNWKGKSLTIQTDAAAGSPAILESSGRLDTNRCHTEDTGIIYIKKLIQKCAYYGFRVYDRLLLQVEDCDLFFARGFEEPTLFIGEANSGATGIVYKNCSIFGTMAGANTGTSRLHFAYNVDSKAAVHNCVVCTWKDSGTGVPTIYGDVGSNNTVYNYGGNAGKPFTVPGGWTGTLKLDPIFVNNIIQSLTDSVATMSGRDRNPTLSSAAILDNCDLAKVTTSDILYRTRIQHGHGPDRGAYEYQWPALCWNYRARYKNSNRLYTTRGSGPFPRELKVPSNVDVSSGCMMDKGQLINPDQFKVKS